MASGADPPTGLVLADQPASSLCDCSGSLGPCVTNLPRLRFGGCVLRVLRAVFCCCVNGWVGANARRLDLSGMEYEEFRLSLLCTARCEKPLAVAPAGSLVALHKSVPRLLARLELDWGLAAGLILPVPDSASSFEKAP